MVFPNQTNHYGTLFGGDALRLMDMAAFVTASRHARKCVITGFEFSKIDETRNAQGPHDFPHTWQSARA
jgi:acyl-CoA hydrolase